MGRQVRVGDGGTDAQAAFGRRLHVVQGEFADVDEPGGALDAALHEVDEVGAAAEEAGVRVGAEQCHGTGDVVRPLVVELPHATASSASGRAVAASCRVCAARATASTIET